LGKRINSKSLPIVTIREPGHNQFIGLKMMYWCNKNRQIETKFAIFSVPPVSQKRTQTTLDFRVESRKGCNIL